MKPYLTIFLLLTRALVSGCATRGLTSLYAELGGRTGIHHIVGKFIAEIGRDPQIRPFFANANLDRFYHKFSEYLCRAADGPCKYTGDNMKMVHEGMHIDEAQFNRVVELLARAMKQQGVPFTVQNRLLARLAPDRKDIIHR